MDKPAIKIKCPSCAITLDYNEKSPYRPFCSERCKNLDFTEWANQNHSIAGTTDYSDILSGELEDPDLNH